MIDLSNVLISYFYESNILAIKRHLLSSDYLKIWFCIKLFAGQNIPSAKIFVGQNYSKIKFNENFRHFCPTLFVQWGMFFILTNSFMCSIYVNKCQRLCVVISVQFLKNPSTSKIFFVCLLFCPKYSVYSGGSSVCLTCCVTYLNFLKEPPNSKSREISK